VLADSVKSVREALAFSGENELIEEYCDILLGSRGGPSFALSVAGIRSFIWQVKRKLAGLSITDPLMPVLFGAQGTGKSVFVNSLLRPLDHLAKNVRVNELTDGRSFLMFRDNFVLFLDEMQKADRADVETLKSILSSSRSSGRIMRSNNVIEVANNCSFIGASNVPVREKIRDSTGMRRFMQIDVPALDKRAAREKARKILEFNVLGLWQSVDERKPNPIEGVYDDLAEHQRELASLTLLQSWIEDRELALAPNIAPVFNASAKLFLDYRDWLDANGKMGFCPSGTMDFGRALARHLESRKGPKGVRGFACGRQLGGADPDHYLNRAVEHRK
jgi:hypothetical protein